MDDLRTSKADANARTPLDASITFTCNRQITPFLVWPRLAWTLFTNLLLSMPMPRSIIIPKHHRYAASNPCCPCPQNSLFRINRAFMLGRQCRQLHHPIRVLCKCFRPSFPFLDSKLRSMYSSSLFYHSLYHCQALTTQDGCDRTLSLVFVSQVFPEPHRVNQQTTSLQWSQVQQ
jgi:hypothetical protein